MSGPDYNQAWRRSVMDSYGGLNRQLFIGTFCVSLVPVLGLVSWWKFLLQVVVIDWAGGAIRTINTRISWQFWWQQGAEICGVNFIYKLLIYSDILISTLQAAVTAPPLPPQLQNGCFSSDKRARYDSPAPRLPQQTFPKGSEGERQKDQQGHSVSPRAPDTWQLISVQEAVKDSFLQRLRWIKKKQLLNRTTGTTGTTGKETKQMKFSRWGFSPLSTRK